MIMLIIANILILLAGYIAGLVTREVIEFFYW